MSNWHHIVSTHQQKEKQWNVEKFLKVLFSKRFSCLLLQTFSSRRLNYIHPSLTWNMIFYLFNLANCCCCNGHHFKAWSGYSQFFEIDDVFLILRGVLSDATTNVLLRTHLKIARRYFMSYMVLESSQLSLKKLYIVSREHNTGLFGCGKLHVYK